MNTAERHTNPSSREYFGWNLLYKKEPFPLRSSKVAVSCLMCTTSFLSCLYTPKGKVLAVPPCCRRSHRRRSARHICLHSCCAHSHSLVCGEGRVGIMNKFLQPADGWNIWIIAAQSLAAAFSAPVKGLCACVCVLATAAFCRKKIQHPKNTYTFLGRLKLKQ